MPQITIVGTGSIDAPAIISSALIDAILLQHKDEMVILMESNTNKLELRTNMLAENLTIKYNVIPETLPLTEILPEPKNYINGGKRLPRKKYKK